ncbi:hypothetical protein [uncultured Negativicoccus sp.]|uniref:hypothetical protein n=1 Tax=uncultured Negativicoccus sp. TaxID=1587526 RepID=UPI0025871691|nr:hypothetical protein [uncultured Negativicoccus sp.]
MRKTALALTVLAAIGASAMATNYYDVDMYYLRDQSKTLTVEDKQHTGDLAVPYLGRGVSEGAVDQAVADIQNFLNQKYGEGQYFVYTDKDVSDHHMNIYVTKDANQVPAQPAPAQPTVAPAPTEPAAVPASTVLADGGIVLQLTDFTKEMAAADREQITAILGNYTYGDSAANLAERAEDAVEHYLGQKYGEDFYDVDVKKLEDGAYDVQIKADDHYKSPGAAVAPAQPTAPAAAFVYELTDFTSQMTDTDRNNITHILNQYVAGDTAANLVEKARNEVQHYLNQTYGEETYKAAVNRLETNAYRMEIRMGSSFIERQVAAEQPAAVKDHTVLELMDYTKALPAEDRAAITEILGKYTYGATPDSLSDQAENAVEYYLDQKYGKDVYDVDRVSLGENAFRIEVKADKNYGK